ncbi:uncharacterized protein LOC129926405 [Biomphalaria glabrata]|uniref:Uncharacterized protein LOC129926405 n=1 Tax=Biomphalaria glabrata TaxID=6526 RepID=A0A9W3AFS2_BIOGL|nr:uncharacterized protein LOC129926405 [Biomphalaria glabrata]
MGSEQSNLNDSDTGSEMASAKDISVEEGDAVQLCSLSDLHDECIQLRAGVKLLAEAIDDVFGERETSSAPTNTEKKLLEITRSNQDIVRNLAKSLEKHAKLFDQGKNEQVMAIVREVVSSVNSYMHMLITNIRKVKRLISEADGAPQRSDRRSGRANSELVYDVISENQDVDAMLLQLMDTLAEREELEKDIIKALILWKTRTS